MLILSGHLQSIKTRGKTQAPSINVKGMAIFYQGIWPWAERYNELIRVNRLLSKVLDKDLKRHLSAIKRVGASDGSNRGSFHS
jgi:hypothetical protein